MDEGKGRSKKGGCRRKGRGLKKIAKRGWGEMRRKGEKTNWGKSEIERRVIWEAREGERKEKEIATQMRRT